MVPAEPARAPAVPTHTDRPLKIVFVIPYASNYPTEFIL